LVYAFCFFNSIFDIFGFGNALFQKINGGIRVEFLELNSKIVIDVIQRGIYLLAGFVLPFFELSEKRVNFALLTKQKTCIAKQYNIENPEQIHFLHQKYDFKKLHHGIPMYLCVCKESVHSGCD